VPWAYHPSRPLRTQERAKLEWHAAPPTAQIRRGLASKVVAVVRAEIFALPPPHALLAPLLQLLALLALLLHTCLAPLILIPSFQE
jgi:hypothetical protein